MIALLWLGSALAGDFTPSVSASLGAEAMLNHLFLRRDGARLGGQIDLFPALSLGASAAGYPDFGDSDRTPLARDLFERGIEPDAAKILADARITASLWAFRRPEARVGVAGSFDLVRTRDFIVGTPLDRFQNETHPAAAIAIVGEAPLAERVAMRVRMERMSWRERIGIEDNPTYSLRYNTMWLGLDLVVSGPLTPKREPAPEESL